MLSDASQVDVMLGLWKDVDLISIELPSMRLLGSYAVSEVDSST